MRRYLARRLREAVRTPLDVDGQQIIADVSIGISLGAERRDRCQISC